MSKLSTADITIVKESVHKRMNKEMLRYCDKTAEMKGYAAQNCYLFYGKAWIHWLKVEKQKIKQGKDSSRAAKNKLMSDLATHQIQQMYRKELDVYYAKHQDVFNPFEM